MAGKIAKEYYLMHKDIAVALMEISDDGRLGNYRINEVAKDHIPLGGQMNEMKFHDWWKDRAIPKTRHGAKTALQRLGYSSTNSALVDNLALSLSDCYWIKPRNEDLSWSDVNLFTNDFIDTFGEITINKDQVIDIRNNTRFSCAASQGELQKKWCIADDGRRYMIKGNYGQSYQQSINEIFATKLHERQEYGNYTEYTLTKIKVEGDLEGLGCLSYDFCNENIECISAWELLQTIKIKQNESYYYPLKKVCTNLGISEDDFTAFMDYQIMTDYLLSNTDRHMNNISIMRDPDTLKILGFAPIYDSGNSMFYNVPFEQLNSVRINDIKTHSFIEREVKLLSYVQNRDLVDIEKAVADFDIYTMDLVERRIRIPKLKELYEKKLNNLYLFQKGKDLWKVSGI
ncbi:HipA domain-containing protein [Inconstantimicrobium porci]|uniref:HipA domain-containing protein n=1 Tax=Inconstantimicrobium porci TaxID=2652291 RepID=UPI002409E4D0|nr:HipA domain-containing protein [Inconstantimicrobium porci]MDD6769434.1 HipA domain-containing protein [Inconstantimicrobium porci]